MDKFVEIWNMQANLNKLYNRSTISGSDESKAWFYDYLWALEDEIFELRQHVLIKWWQRECQEDPTKQYCAIIGMEKAKVELIDALHFIISIFQLRSMDSFVKPIFFEGDYLDYEYSNIKPSSIETGETYKHIEMMIDAIRTLKREHSSDYKNKRMIDNDPLITKKINEALYSIWLLFLSLCKTFGITPDDMLNIYKEKHQKNMDRQKNGYSLTDKKGDTPTQ